MEIEINGVVARGTASELDDFVRLQEANKAATLAEARTTVINSLLEQLPEPEPTPQGPTPAVMPLQYPDGMHKVPVTPVKLVSELEPPAPTRVLLEFDAQLVKAMRVHCLYEIPFHRQALADYVNEDVEAVGNALYRLSKPHNGITERATGRGMWQLTHFGYTCNIVVGKATIDHKGEPLIGQEIQALEVVESLSEGHDTPPEVTVEEVCVLMGIDPKTKAGSIDSALGKVRLKQPETLRRVRPKVFALIK